MQQTRRNTVEARGEANPTVDEMAPSERKRLGRLGGMLLIIGSVAAAPAAAFLEPEPDPIEYLISVAGIALGALLMAIPWERLSERALYSVPSSPRLGADRRGSTATTSPSTRS